MKSPNPVEIERMGANAGLNPMFGDWQIRVDSAPIPYGNGGARLAEFRRVVQEGLTNQFLYSDDVRLEITLHLDTQTVLETDETADVDNYAKAISDCLKGPNGLILDDSQVQTLIISRIDSYGRDEVRFDVSISSGPDDFILKPVEFYEMPDGLWYPCSRRLWSEGKAQDRSAMDHYAELSILEMMTAQSRGARHQFRRSGMDRLRAFRTGRYLSSSARGFHRSRIDDGFPMNDRAAWQAELRAWKAANAAEIAEIEAGFAKMREAFEAVVTSVTSHGPAER